MEMDISKKKFFAYKNMWGQNFFFAKSHNPSTNPNPNPNPNLFRNSNPNPNPCGGLYGVTGGGNVWWTCMVDWE